MEDLFSMSFDLGSQLEQNSVLVDVMFYCMWSISLRNVVNGPCQNGRIHLCIFMHAAG